VPKPAKTSAKDDVEDGQKDPFEGLAPGSAHIKISLPLLEALANLSSVGARDNSVTELQNANESARRILKEYMNTEFTDRKPIPKAFMDLFTPGAQSEINWEGVVLKIHQSYLESPELQTLMQKILRTHEEESPAPVMKQSLERFPFLKGGKMFREEAPTPELPSRNSHPKLLKGLPFVPVKPDADKRTITSLVPNPRVEEQRSPRDARSPTEVGSEEEDDEMEEEFPRPRMSTSFKETSIEVPRDDREEKYGPIKTLSNSFKETLAFPRSGMTPQLGGGKERDRDNTNLAPAKVTTGFNPQKND